MEESGKICKDLKEKDSNEEEERWYKELEETSECEKLKSLRKICYKRIKVYEQSKQWWDEELSVQLKITRGSRKGKEGQGIN